MSNETLYVITPIFNSWRYKSRIRLYNEYKEYINRFSNVQLVTIEAAFASRPYEAVFKEDNFNIQLRTNSELWHKERMINLAIQNLPNDWKYVAWIDGDIRFAREDWATETIYRLHHYSVIQLYSESINLGPDNTIIGNKRESFFSAYMNNRSVKFSSYYGFPHPGFAWAATKEAINGVGGLSDTHILGSGDLMMARALIGKVEEGLDKDLSSGYKEQLILWQDRAERNIRRNVGFVPGLLVHHWHGSRKDRRYNERWKILTKHKFDPEFDIKPDWQGLYQYTGNKPELEYEVREYFASRNEDVNIIIN